MSVIHDVLKDLHDRHRQQQLDECLPFIKEEMGEPNTRRWLGYAAWIVTLSCVYLVVNVTTFRETLYDPATAIIPETNPIPQDLLNHSVTSIVKLEDQANTEINDQDIMKEAILRQPLQQSNEIFSDSKENLDRKIDINGNEILTNQDNEYSKHDSELDSFQYETKKYINKKNDVQRDDSESHNIKRELGKSSLSINPNSQINMRAVSVSSQSIFDEGRIKLWMQSEPQKVWPYIKSNVPDFINHIHLIALSAQAEQRSDHHDQAMYLYNLLINREPKQGRWKIGMAISLDAQGNQGAAKTYYQQGLSDQSLPVALKQFAYQRLQLLETRGMNDR